MKHEKQQSVLFTAELQHSEETFYRLARVQAQLYGALGKVFVIFCGFALIAAALFALQESTGRLVLLFFGCIFFFRQLLFRNLLFFRSP